MGTGRLRLAALTAGLTVLGLLVLGGPVSASPMPGAVWTTDAGCQAVNLNIYASGDDVYVSGGPASAKNPGLPDGSYYVQVTAPDGTVLGSSGGPVVTVQDGRFGCFQLSSLVFKASDGTPGFDATPNPGGEYKVWISTDAGFAPNASKTDAFKSASGGGGSGGGDGGGGGVPS